MRRTVAGLLAALALLLYGAAAAQAQGEIGAIGRIAPAGGMTGVSGPPGAVVRVVHVKPGDVVKRGDLLLSLDDEPVKAELDLASLDLQSATKLAEERVAAQAAALRLAQQRLKRAERELATYRGLGRNAMAEREESRLQGLVEDAKTGVEIEQGKQRLLRIEGETAVRSAAKRLENAQSKGSATEVRAPADGTILRVDRRVGERLGGEPAIAMADLRAMQVTCQVHEGDLLKLTPGMRTVIKSAALAQPLSGTVEQIGRLVDTRSRLGEVIIKLQNAEPASRLIGMEVEVVISR